MTPLQALAERLEKATGPDEELAFDLWRALTDTQGVPADVAWRLAGQPNLLSSLDAAIALCERVLPDNMRWSISNAAVKPRANVFPLSPTRPIMGPYSSAATPALALCLAIVRARIAEETP